ncbi:MAG: 5-formyltetrahydrofolate cyclo-ligase [Parvibaculaceae bacterium]
MQKRVNDVVAFKRQARTMAAAKRAKAHKALGDRGGLLLAQHEFPVTRGSGAAWVSGFHPYQDEISVLPLLARLVSEGWFSALPVVIAKGKPLVFRAWAPGEPTTRGVWDIHIPPESAPEAAPDVLLVPLLGFDRRGYRLGYGGGFYDRTLAELRQKKAITAIGIGYADQELDEVPIAAYDEPLDWIMTERGVIDPKRS